MTVTAGTIELKERVEVQFVAGATQLYPLPEIKKIEVEAKEDKSVSSSKLISIMVIMTLVSIWLLWLEDFTLIISTEKNRLTNI